MRVVEACQQQSLPQLWTHWAVQSPFSQVVSIEHLAAFAWIRKSSDPDIVFSVMALQLEQNVEQESVLVLEKAEEEEGTNHGHETLRHRTGPSEDAATA